MPAAAKTISRLGPFLLAALLMVIPLYPKFPLVGVSGSFVSVRLEDFLIAGLTALWLIKSLPAASSSLNRPMHRSILLYWLVGFAAVFSGIFLTKTAALNLGLLHYFRRIEYMVVFFIGYDFLSSRAQTKFIVNTIILTAFLIAVYGLGQQFAGWPVISTSNSEFSKGLALTLGPGARINSTFAGHYDLAAFSVLPLIMILSFFTLQLSRPQKVLLAIAGSAIYWSLLLSASRITFASFFLAAFILAVLVKKHWWIVPLGILALVSIVITPQLRGRYFQFITHVRAAEESKAVDTVPDALKPPAQPEDRSFNIRLRAEWPKAGRAFQKNPLLGTGFSSVGLAVDNDYLRTLAETGILGLIAFGGIFIRFYKSSWPYLFKFTPDLTSCFLISVSISLFSLLVNSVFIDIFAASKIAIFTWAVLGAAEKIKALK